MEGSARQEALRSACVFGTGLPGPGLRAVGSVPRGAPQPVLTEASPHVWDVQAVEVFIPAQGEVLEDSLTPNAEPVWPEDLVDGSPGEADTFSKARNWAPVKEGTGNRT